MTMNQLVKVMEGLGVTSFGEIGEAFDPARHNAVMHVEQEGLGENVIAEVFRRASSSAKRSSASRGQGCK